MIKNKKIIGILTGTLIISSVMVGCENEDTTTQGQQSAKTSEQAVNIETEKKEVVEKEIYNENGVKVIYKNTEKDEYGDIRVNLRIENNTEGEVLIQARDTSVDGIMIEPSISDEIMPGKVINTDLAFMSFDLEDNDIDSFTKLETKLLVMDENWDDLFEIPINLDVEVEK